jgi:lipopolysaccharide/colanic/teichoic acid biosynthesis glycosyltransferase
MSYKLTVTPTVRVTKRAIDLFASVLGLAATLPLYPFISAAIYAESPGPDLSIDSDAGMLKGFGSGWGVNIPFRRVRHAQVPYHARRRGEVTRAVIAQANDPRITKVGRFLRKTRLDELPQLWNVLVGEMSSGWPPP